MGLSVREHIPPRINRVRAWASGAVRSRARRVDVAIRVSVRNTLAQVSGGVALAIGLPLMMGLGDLASLPAWLVPWGARLFFGGLVIAILVFLWHLVFGVRLAATLDVVSSPWEGLVYLAVTASRTDEFEVQFVGETRKPGLIAYIPHPSGLPWTDSNDRVRRITREATAKAIIATFTWQDTANKEQKTLQVKAPWRDKIKLINGMLYAAAYGPSISQEPWTTWLHLRVTSSTTDPEHIGVALRVRMAEHYAVTPYLTVEAERFDIDPSNPLAPEAFAEVTL